MDAGLEKIESSSANIHYEFRTTHLMMDKRLNSIMSDYNNMNEQIKLIRNEIPADSYLSTQNLLAKSAFLKNRKTSRLFPIQNIVESSNRVVVSSLRLLSMKLADKGMKISRLKFRAYLI
jgi:hypothetical protein